VANQFTSFEDWQKPSEPEPVEPASGDDEQSETVFDRMREGRMTEDDDRARAEGRLGED
jgi:hypothetical protein